MPLEVTGGHAVPGSRQAPVWRPRTALAAHARTTTFSGNACTGPSGEYYADFSSPFDIQAFRFTSSETSTGSDAFRDTVFPQLGLR